MPKEDRSDWVAVAPDKSSSTGPESIKPAATAFQFYQKHAAEEIKQELIAQTGKFQVGDFSRKARDKWNALSEEDRAPFDQMALEDQMRYARESHMADVAAIERRERLQRERDTVLLDDQGGTQRTTRRQFKKKARKKEKKSKKAPKRVIADDEEFVDEDEDESSDSYSEGSEEESSDSDDSYKRKKKKAPKPKRPQSQKQVEYRERQRQEKKVKEDYIAERQKDLKKEKSAQAKKRLEYLLRQSNIFSHFGAVKEDHQKFGVKQADAAKSRREAVELRGDDANQEDLDDADEHQATFLTSQPSTLGFGQMRPYQLEGLNWMIRLQENGVNGILADEMGLGKTLQTISILVYMLEYQNNTGPHLVVVPKSTLSNWMIELGRWAPTLKAVKFHGNKEERQNLAENVLCPGQRDEDRSWNVCVTTYEICNIEKNVFNKFAWTYLIIDEAHRLKNEASAFSKTVRGFETQYRILITGTPLQNSLHELWALLNFLVPDVFANAEQFDEWFNLDIDDNDEKNRLISQLHKILKPFMLRRLKKEVETNLPPKHETILFTGMSAMQKKLYRDILIRDIDAIQGKSGSRTAILNIVMQLRKCAGHPYLFPGVEDRTLPPLGEHLVENCGKMVLLDKLLKRLREKGHRVLLFTQMTRILDIMEDYLLMRRYPYCRIDGNTSYEMREDYIEAYNRPNSEKFIFLLSTRAGGLGINLQTANVVILYDSDWNPQADLQAMDRAHRIGQTKEVQVFRFVTEHTVEEKIIERAQQKLKLDAMVVQQGRLRGKDKLSRDELLEAVRFGADKIFKSKDSSITDEDIDLILEAGKRKTQELNDKLQTADKGDLLDFKFDASSNLQTFEGVDYSSNALAAAKAEAELMGILDVGKRERRTANYNENQMYQAQMAANQVKKKKKARAIKLPKEYRLPRMDEWQMYNRKRLLEIQELEEQKFHSLPEEIQRAATQKKEEPSPDGENREGKSRPDGDAEEASDPEKQALGPLELPPLISDELKEEKKSLLSEGFNTWTRSDYSRFIKASSQYGRSEIAKIAADINKEEKDVEIYASAFWGDLGKARISEPEYDRVVKLVEKGEKKLSEMKALQRGTCLFVSLFENPWEELEFLHVNTKDKMFSADNDRYLLCWAEKFGYGQWEAIRLAIRHSPKFRFDYFLRSQKADHIGRRCEHLMRAAVKEVEQLEKKERELQGLPTEAEDGKDLPPVKLRPFKEMQKLRRLEDQEKKTRERKELEDKVDGIAAGMKQIQDRLKELNRSTEEVLVRQPVEAAQHGSKMPAVAKVKRETAESSFDPQKGDVGPNGEFVEFPDYDGLEPPKENKKAFTHFCVRNRKQVKASLSGADKKDKRKVNDTLKERWLALTDNEKDEFREWAAWDKKRFVRDSEIYNTVKQAPKGNLEERSGRKREVAVKEEGAGSPPSIPKKKRAKY